MKKLIYPYSQKFSEIFKRKKEKISKHIKNVEIYHIGSTSVPYLGGKGMIDIMIGIKKWEELENAVNKLKLIGFNHVHLKEKGRVFLSRIGSTKKGDTHIHIVIVGGRPYKELLLFRNYLRKNKKEADRYFRLKQEWATKTNEDRIKYGKLKSKYIKEILIKAKQK